MSKSKLIKKIISAIRSVTGSGLVQLHEPNISNYEWKFLKRSLDLRHISSVGNFVKNFENKIKQLTNSKYVIAVNSGTSALHLSLLSLNVKPNEEILIPNLNYVASANVTRYCGAIPHFIDIERDTLGIDVIKLKKYLNNISKIKNGKCINKKTKRVIKAIIPMHTFGHPIKIKSLLKVSKQFKLNVIEDAAEAIGSYYENIHVGTFGKIGVLSFNGNKTITTGCGVAILTNNKKIAKRVKRLSSICKIYNKWEQNYNGVGYNYAMPNMNAALGCAQIKNINKLIKLKRKLFYKYSIAFKDIHEVKIFKEPKNCKSNYWLQTILLKSSNLVKRNIVLKETRGKKIITRPAWMLMHKIKHFNKFPKMNLDCSKNLVKRIINIPSSSQLV